MSEPFSAIFFTRLFHLMISFNFLCFSRYFLPRENEFILSCFCFIQKVVEMRLFFFEVANSFTMQYPCEGLIESANFLLWVRSIKHLLFIDELKVRAFLTALPKPSNAYTLCSLNYLKKNAISPMRIHPYFPRAKLSESAFLNVSNPLKHWLSVLEPMVHAFLAAFRWVLLQRFWRLIVIFLYKKRIFLMM